MPRISLLGYTPAEQDALRNALVQRARELGVHSCDVKTAEHASALLGPPACHVLLCSLDTAGQPQRSPDPALLAQLRSLREHYPSMPLVATSRRRELALVAYEQGLSFMPLPPSAAALDRTIWTPLAGLSWKERPHLAVRTSGRVDNVALDDIQFIESGKRGPLIHLPGRQSVVARGTLKSVFERLDGVRTGMGDYVSPSAAHGDKRPWPYVMVGSSFIVNLGNVRASGEGVLVFSDGETIIVPVRKRRAVEEQLSAYQNAQPDKAVVARASA